MSTEDLFDGLRKLPSDLPQLREHLHEINQTLQTKYCLPAELTEFALQPEQSEEFYDLYDKEINRIINHLSKVTGNKYEVKVGPMKYASGVVVQHAQNEHDRAKGAHSDGNNINNNVNYLSALPVSSSQTAQNDEILSGTFESKWESALHLANKQIALRELCEKEIKAVCAEANKTWLECTPAAQIHSQKNTYGDKMPQGDSTNTASSPDNDQMSTGVVDSEIRARKESELFSTPPEFNGFNVPMATPSSSDGVSPLNEGLLILPT